MIFKDIKTSDNRSIKIFDNVFDTSERISFYEFCRELNFQIIGKDSSLIEHQSDLTMVSIFTPEIYEKSSFSYFIKKKDERIKNILSNTQIHSCMLNLTTPSDNYYTHTDSVTGSEGYTLLYYANLDWNPNWFGETIFYNENLKDYEFVSPYIPGRIIIFDGNIPHCIRPQVFSASRFRMTLAIKFTKEKK
jgi:hypothetical protein